MNNKRSPDKQANIMHSLMMLAIGTAYGTRLRQDEYSSEVDNFVRDKAYTEGLRDSEVAGLMDDKGIGLARERFLESYIEDMEHRPHIWDIYEHYLMGFDHGLKISSKMSKENFNMYAKGRKHLFECYRKKYGLK